MRLRFAKRGDVRLVSHHDLLRCLERMLRRSDLPVAHTQGFSPHPRLTFPLALALGIEGRREVLEIEMAQPLEPSEVLRRLAEVSPPGLDFLDAEPARPGRAARVEAACYALAIPAERRSSTVAAATEFLASPSWPFLRQRPDRSVEVDLRPFVLSLELDAAGMLRFRLRITPTGSARPEEVAAALGLRDLLAEGAILIRTDVELAPDSPAERDLAPATSGEPAAAPPDSTGPQPERTTA